MERDFKWIWIPKDIWLSEELTIQDKIMFVEIQSLDNNAWCYATNAYFAKFFWLSEDRISRIISSLYKRWYISVDIDKVNGNTRIIHTLSLNPPIGENTQSYNKNNNTDNKEKKIKIVYIQDKTELETLVDNEWIRNELYIIWIMIDIWYRLNSDKQSILDCVARVKLIMSRYVPRKEDGKLDRWKAKAGAEDWFIYHKNKKTVIKDHQSSLNNWMKPFEDRKRK